MFKQLTAVALLGLLATGCAAPLPLSSTRLVERFGQDAVFANSDEGGNKMATLEIVPPKEGGYQVQAVVHRWVEADIFEYRATLKVQDGDSYVDVSTPLTVTIPRKGTDAKTKAVFTKLKQGSKYQISLVAMGDVGGTAASSALNADTATTAIFDFTAGQDVEDTLAESMRISFDTVAFSGTGTATVTTPEEGTYQNPASPEAGVAE